MANDFDVAIVGAGPAGAWAAYRLASAGARVAIVDGSHPREKPCGGGLSARALELLQPVVERLPASIDASRARFTASGMTAPVTLRARESRGPALAITSRRELDAALLQAAEQSGAHHVPHRVLGFERRNGGWNVETDSQQLTASWLIGADGANSLVRRRVATAFSRRDLSVASGYFVHGRTSADIDIEFTIDPPGYLWSFPRPDHLAVGICGQADATSSARLFDAARRWIAANASAADGSLTRYSWPIPSLTAEALRDQKASGDRWILVGDAAGLVDPITREGIFFALQSAEFAASSVQSANASGRYARLLAEHIYPELKRASQMKTQFFASAFSALLVRGLQRSYRIRAIMADLVSGRQTYHGLRRRLLLTGELRLALAYLHLTATTWR
jgi:geranylgeranyl reductase family protein